jgi:putative Mg2+ transporter-C (MgtC) family protein
MGGQRTGHNAPVPSQLELVLRILLAAGLAGALGVERELTDQPAGLRTHILVGLGAALFAVISAYGFDVVIEGERPAVQADVTRVASQIVVGIGFLAGGVILKSGASIRGLTTAANLWITAAIGTAVGLGMLLLASVAAGIALVALVGLRPLRRALERRAKERQAFVIEAGRDLDLGALLQALRDVRVAIGEVRIEEEAGDQTIHLQIRLPPGVRPGEIVSLVASLDHVRNVDWSG